MGCDLNYSEDQRQILDAAAAMLDASYPVARLRDEKPDSLSALAEFGAFALAASEEHGGSGFSIVEEALLHTHLGRHVVSTRALATTIAARLAREFGRDDLAEQATAGSAGICAAIPSGDSVLLIDPSGAETAIVFGDCSLTLLDLGGIKGEDITGLGHGPAMTRIRPGPLPTNSTYAQGPLLDIADLLVSAQLLGVAEAARDLAISYALVREQFGKPIAAFQAIKHHCANMAIGAEMLSSQLDMAAIALRDGRADASFQVAALRLLAPKTALANARTCIQIHGGIGFSAEADAHHYLKQAHTLRQLGSGANMLGLPAPLAPHTQPERN